MPRPLMQHGVGQLEEMFASGKDDAKLLKHLENELRCRQVPRAVALLAEVQAAMYGGTVAPQVLTVPAPPPAQAPASAFVSQQPELWGRPSVPLTIAALTRAGTSEVRPAEALPAPSGASASPPAIPLEDAYKTLKATPGATWESIEQTRRTLVQQSHPSRWKTLSTEKRAQTLTEARRVNAAYAALSQARCGGR